MLNAALRGRPAAAVACGNWFTVAALRDGGVAQWGGTSAEKGLSAA
eukprot:gene24330-16444_t